MAEGINRSPAKSGGSGGIVGSGGGAAATAAAAPPAPAPAPS